MPINTHDTIMTNLATSIAALKGLPAYGEPDIRQVFRYWPVLEELKDEQLPCVILDDNGALPGPEYAGDARFISNINVNAIVRADTSTEIVNKLEIIASALTKYFYSNPSLGANVLIIRNVERGDVGVFSRSNRNMAHVFMTIAVVWYDTLYTPAAPVGSDTYNEEWLDLARDKLLAELNELKTTMATGYDPTFSYVYDRHLIAKLQLNAVSIDLRQADSIMVGANDLFIRWMMIFNLRLHTAYFVDMQDGRKNSRLLNSIANKLKANLNFGAIADGYRIEGVANIVCFEQFQESATFGGSMDVTVSKTVQHSQE